MVLSALVLVLAACGGEGDTSTTAGDGGSTAAPTTTAATTTAAPPVVAGNDFCGFIADYAENAAISPIGLSPEAIEAAFKQNLDAINQAVDLAPGEIKGDVEMFADAYGGFVDFLGDYGYNFLAIPEDALNDPRLAVMDSPELVAAGDRIEEFCGLDDLIADPPDAGGGGGALPPTELPDGFPGDLEPPGGEVVAVVNIGTGESVTFDVEGSTDDIIAFYEDQLGAPTQSLDTPKGALWITEYEGQQLTLAVSEVGTNMVQVNVTLL